MKQIIATVPVWLTSNSYTLANLRDMTPERAASTVTYYQPYGDTKPEGWVKVGSAEVIITFDVDAEITGQQIAVLWAAQTKIKADCELALTQLEAQIQSLLATECRP